MKTLTITNAKRNLGKWLQAAAQGEEIGIISGADIIALRKVDVEAADDYTYGMREYEVTRDDLKKFERNLEDRAAALDKNKKWKQFSSVKHLRASVEKIAQD
jgi:antitoxin (DNA-binding transcriptional repressor) of toxin-antitoxin stability system